MEINKNTVIIGAGLTGLTTAYNLKKKGIDILILEKKDHIGGVINTKKFGDFIYEEGPNTGVIGNAAVVELFDELSDIAELEKASNNVKKRYILKNGNWHHIPMGLADAITTPLYSTKDKFNLLIEPFRKKGKNPAENLSQLVKRRLGKSFLNYTVDPFILGVYAGDPDYLIPKYALPKLYNLEQKYGSFILGSIRKSLEKKTELEKRAKKEVFSFKAGLSSLVYALEAKINKNNILLNCNNIKISPIDNNWLTVIENLNGDKTLIKSQNIITTTGAYTLKDLLPFISADIISKIDNLLYTKVWEIALGFNKWNGRILDGFGGLIPHLEKRDILGILFMSSLFQNRCPKDGALLSIFMGGVRRQDLMQISENEVAKIVERETKNLLNLNEFNPDLFKIIKHSKAIPQYGIESKLRFDTIENLQKNYPGLYIAGNLRNGIGMADRIQQAKNISFEI